MKLYDVALSIGHTVGTTPTHTHQQVITKACEVLNINSYSAWEINGMYNGLLESSTRMEINALTETEANELLNNLEELAYKLEQESIAATKRECESVLYFGERYAERIKKQA